MWHIRKSGKRMAKPRTERSLLFPSEEFRERVRNAAKDRGFRSEQAFILAACENEIRRGENTDATTQFEARVAATLTNLAKQVQGLQTLAHAQVALTDVFLKYVITCVVEPPEDVLEEVLRVDPKSALALYYRALCLAKQGRLQEAEQDCRAAKANATEPGLKSVIEEMLTDIPGVAISDQMSAAIEHMNQGRWFPAVTELDTVLQIHPRCFNAYKYKAL